MQRQREAQLRNGIEMAAEGVMKGRGRGRYKMVITAFVTVDKYGYITQVETANIEYPE